MSSKVKMRLIGECDIKVDGGKRTPTLILDFTSENATFFLPMSELNGLRLEVPREAFEKLRTVLREIEYE